MKSTHRAAARAELAVDQNWNMSIRDSVDALLAEAGYKPDSSARHQLAMMNFDQKAQSTPAWHDAPEVAALKAERDAAMKDAERYRYLRGQQHWSEALEKAIDAAIANAEGRKE